MSDQVPGIDFPLTVWKISNLERNINDGVVFTAHYTITRYKDGEQAGAYGSIGLDAPDPETMIPYVQLTEELACQWIQDKFGPEKCEQIIQALDTQISEKLTPVKAAGVPWITGPQS